jgi:hypothetical protein
MFLCVFEEVDAVTKKGFPAAPLIVGAERSVLLPESRVVELGIRAFLVVNFILTGFTIACITYAEAASFLWHWWGMVVTHLKSALEYRPGLKGWECETMIRVHFYYGIALFHRSPQARQISPLRKPRGDNSSAKMPQKMCEGFWLVERGSQADIGGGSTAFSGCCGDIHCLHPKRVWTLNATRRKGSGVKNEPFFKSLQS